MVDGRGADGEKEERRKREVCSPEGFKAGAGLRGSYTAPPFAVTNSTWPPLWTPFSVPPSSSSSFSFFFFLFVHLFRPSSPNRNYSLLVPLPPTLDKYVRVLRPPFLACFVPLPFITSPPKPLLLPFRVPCLSLIILDLCASVFLSRVYALLTVINPCSVNISALPR